MLLAQIYLIVIKSHKNGKFNDTGSTHKKWLCKSVRECPFVRKKNISSAATCFLQKRIKKLDNETMFQIGILHSKIYDLTPRSLESEISSQCHCEMQKLMAAILKSGCHLQFYVINGFRQKSNPHALCVSNKVSLSWNERLLQLSAPLLGLKDRL